MAEVEKGGPAEAAGMKAGDVIVDVDDTVITSFQEMNNIISAKNAGDVLKVKVFRIPGAAENGLDDDRLAEGEYIDLEVTLAIVDIPEEDPQDEGFLYAQ